MKMKFWKEWDHFYFWFDTNNYKLGEKKRKEKEEKKIIV